MFLSRQHGVISNWKADKGFGFIQPDDGSSEIFVHINEFKGEKRRPVSGDRVSYRVALDAEARAEARAVRFQDQWRAARLPADKITAAAFISGYIVLIMIAVHRRDIPWHIPAALFAWNLIAYLAYWKDKRAAERGAWRTTESMLHILALLGGWPAGWIAQLQFRHKSSKTRFKAVFYLTIFCNIAALIYFTFRH